MRRLAGIASGLVAALALTIAAMAPGTVSPVAAAEPRFGTPTLTTSFEDGVTVTQPVTLTEEPARIELLLRTADATAPLVREIELPALELADVESLTYTLDTTDGHILPNTPIEARWRITPRDGGTPVVGPAVDGVYADDRFAWQTLVGDVVRVHWYEGSDAFGARALAIGDEAVATTAELLGVTEDEPVDFFIYADEDAFYDALGPGTRENVGGQANAGIRTLFALISPGDIDAAWVGEVIPHELVHLVFDTAVANPYHFPPRWLNEGLATYLSAGYGVDDRATVERAARDGTLIPLSGLTGQFPTSPDRFFQAYAQSVSAVDFFIRTHGQEALVALIGSYAEGRTDDEAFSAAIGMDGKAFDAAWMADLGAVAPTRHGPLTAPAGPQPPGWGTAPESSGGAAPGTDPVTRVASVVLVVGGLLVAVVVVVAIARSRRGRMGVAS